MAASRFEVVNHEGPTESECGPDYFTTGEYRVIERATGEIVARFPWTLDEPYLTNKFYSGPDRVVISDDETEAAAYYGDGRVERAALPPKPRP
jgi:hypothetical protein